MCEVTDCCFCGCYDPDMGCTMDSIDRTYACPLYSDNDFEPENED